MSGLTYKDQTIVREAVQRYLDIHGMTTLRAIAKFVKETTGIYPAATTIARLVRENGYDMPQAKWEWKKIK